MHQKHAMENVLGVRQILYDCQVKTFLFAPPLVLETSLKLDVDPQNLFNRDLTPVQRLPI